MRKEINSIISMLQYTLEGAPWYGRPVYDILREADPARVNIRPSDASHTLLELLYHMLSWAEFTRMQLEKEPGFEPDAYEKTMDWRVIDGQADTWEKGVALFRQSHERIVEFLSGKEDDFLAEEAQDRKYNFRFLLHGLIQHNIYHQGQIALLNKLLMVG